MKAVIVTFDRFTDIDVFLPWDLLNRVRLRDKTFEVRLVGPSPMHKSVCGLEVPTHGGLDECSDAAIVFFASGPGTRDLIKDESVLKQIQLSPNSQIICSMCSGALILAASEFSMDFRPLPIQLPSKNFEVLALKSKQKSTLLRMAILARLPDAWLQ